MVIIQNEIKIYYATKNFHTYEVFVIDGDRRIVLRGTAAQTALAKSLIEEKVEEDGELRRSAEFNPRAPRSPSRQLCISSTAENVSYTRFRPRKYTNFITC